MICINVSKLELDGEENFPSHFPYGIRQGGVISPILFCVYIDELLLKLADKGIGCWVGSQYFGALGYANDLTLLSPSVAGLREMLRICEDFSNEYSVKYNAENTV